MTDLERFEAFLDGVVFPYEIERKPDVMLLPMDPKEINYVSYATRIKFAYSYLYFNVDGELTMTVRADSEAA